MTDLLSRAEVAAILGVPVKRLELWAWQRRGPPYRRRSTEHRRGPVFYNRNELDDWIADTGFIREGQPLERRWG